MLNEAIVIRKTSVANHQHSIGGAAREIWVAFGRAPQWGTLAWNDIKLRYRRTTLGPFWITSGLGATVFSVGILYGILFGNDLSRYLPYFAAGLVVWVFIGTTLGDGCAVYISAAAIIRAVPVAPAVHVCRLLTRQFIMFMHNLSIILLLWLLFPWPLGGAFLLIVPGLVLNIIVLLGAVSTLGIIAARFRDIQLIISTLLQLVFLLTPIMWEAKELSNASISYVAGMNPFFHLIEIVRRPLLGEAPTLASWVYSGIAAAVCGFVGVLSYARYRHRVAFWL
jgi:ABC-type polysaccharide/polyol phosphate export permease